jgi:putative salt-induced outer membrane protein
MIRTALARPCVLFIGLAAMPFAASADDLPQGWSGKGQAGFVMARGNSDTDAANAKLDMNFLRGDWQHTLSLDALYGRSAGITASERWDLRFQSNYNITTKLFTFGALTYQNDKFSGFQYQESATGGMGYKLLDTDTVKFALQVGVGYRQSRAETLEYNDPANSTNVTGRTLDPDTEKDVVGTFGWDFQYRFNSSTKLTDKLAAESGSSNTSLKNDLALEVKMSKKLSLAAGYSVLENTTPAAGVKHVDQITTLNIVYAFNEPPSK